MVAYDFACPSVSLDISQRTCAKCGHYYATQKSLKEHHKICNPSVKLKAERISQRPVRIAAARQKEKMVVWKSVLNDENVDWFDDDELDKDEIEGGTGSTQDDDKLPIVSITAHMQNPWEVCTLIGLIFFLYKSIDYVFYYQI